MLTIKVRRDSGGVKRRATSVAEENTTDIITEMPLAFNLANEELGNIERTLTHSIEVKS